MQSLRLNHNSSAVYMYMYREKEKWSQSLTGLLQFRWYMGIKSEKHERIKYLTKGMKTINNHYNFYIIYIHIHTLHIIGYNMYISSSL